MRITEFARKAGVSPRALRHYEEQGLLIPARTPAGYRDYDFADLDVVARVRLMLDAGLNAATIRRYLSCVASGEDGHDVIMCADLRGALDEVACRLDRDADRIARTRGALESLAPHSVKG